MNAINTIRIAGEKRNKKEVEFGRINDGNRYCFLKRMEYCARNGAELFSASLVTAVCQDSKVFHVR